MVEHAVVREELDPLELDRHGSTYPAPRPRRPRAPPRATARRGRGTVSLLGRRRRPRPPPRRRRSRRAPLGPEPPARASTCATTRRAPADRSQRCGRAVARARGSGRRLAEADPRIEADPLLRDPGGDGEREPFLEEGGDLGDDVVVVRSGLHRGRTSLHVHEAEVRAGLGDDGGELQGSRRSAVTSLTIAVGEKAPTLGDLGARGVRAENHRASLASSCEHRDARGGAPRRARRRRRPDGSTRRRRRPSAAPSDSIPRAASAASPAEPYSPPSEKLSGVTFTTPITAGARPTFAPRRSSHPAWTLTRAGRGGSGGGTVAVALVVVALVAVVAIASGGSDAERGSRRASAVAGPARRRPQPGRRRDGDSRRCSSP